VWNRSRITWITRCFDCFENLSEGLPRERTSPSARRGGRPPELSQPLGKQASSWREGVRIKEVLTHTPVNTHHAAFGATAAALHCARPLICRTPTAHSAAHTHTHTTRTGEVTHSRPARTRTSRTRTSHTVLTTRLQAGYPLTCRHPRFYLPREIAVRPGGGSCQAWEVQPPCRRPRGPPGTTEVTGCARWLRAGWSSRQGLELEARPRARGRSRGRSRPRGRRRRRRG
jgi:hypothetical protein